MSEKQDEDIQKNEGQLLMFHDPEKNTNIQVKMLDETVWLTQEQIAMLFHIDQSGVSKHLKNIFTSGELDEKSNMQFLHITNSDKPVKHYNLDVGISLSKKGIYIGLGETYFTRSTHASKKNTKQTGIGIPD